MPQNCVQVTRDEGPWEPPSPSWPWLRAVFGSCLYNEPRSSFTPASSAFQSSAALGAAFDTLKNLVRKTHDTAKANQVPEKQNATKATLQVTRKPEPLQNPLRKAPETLHFHTHGGFRPALLVAVLKDLEAVLGQVPFLPSSSHSTTGSTRPQTLGEVVEKSSLELRDPTGADLKFKVAAYCLAEFCRRLRASRHGMC